MAKSNSIMTAVLAIGGIGLIYLIYKNSAAAKAAGAAASLAPGATAALPGPSSSSLGPLDITAQYETVPAVTSGQVASAASLWASLTPAQVIVSGYIDFPSGSQAAASLFEPRTDASGNYYVQWAGQVYVLGAMDAQGNWPATLAGS